MGEHKTSFTSFETSTAEDWQVIATAEMEFYQGHPDRILRHLQVLAEDNITAFPVDRLTHSLQTAARAEKAGRSDEYVLCALIHDIGDTLGCFNHADIAAAILKPFVSEDLHWMVTHHGEFQGYYFFHHIGADRNVRDTYTGHPSYDLTAEFCAEFDQVSFDAAYPTPPLEHFAPLVHELMARPRRSLYVGDTRTA